MTITLYICYCLFFLNTGIFKIPMQFLKTRGVRSFLFCLCILKNARGKFKKLRIPLDFKNYAFWQNLKLIFFY